jgi:hypothetical protein
VPAAKLPALQPKLPASPKSDSSDDDYEFDFDDEDEENKNDNKQVCF